MQVIATKPFSKNLYRRAPATSTCHEKGAKSSVLNTGEITLVFYGLHRGNLPTKTDIPGLHSEEARKSESRVHVASKQPSVSNPRQSG